MIPKCIYLTYKNSNIPNKFLQRWKDLNNDYEIKFYDDNDCFEFIRNNFGEDYSSYFSEIKIGPYKADFWRLCILYVNGGIYSDIDIVPHVPINKIIEDSDLCTCLAMNKTSIFQAFLACSPKNELIKLCLDSFYAKRNDKNFLKELKNCDPTYDMFNVFCNYLNKIKIKPNKCYYKKNQKIKILQETGEDYLNAYVVYKGYKLLSSRDIEYVNMNKYNISWITEIPPGNFIQTSRNLQIKDDIMYVDCLDKNNIYIPNKIKFKYDHYYENNNGFVYSNLNNNNNAYIPKNIYMPYFNNVIKDSNFNYFLFTDGERDKFIKNNFNDFFDIYTKQPIEIKNYIWALSIIYKKGGIYISNMINKKNINYINNSVFVSSIDIHNKLNFNYFSSIKKSKIIYSILINLIDFLKKNNIKKEKKIIKIGSNKYPIKIIEVPGIIECNNIPWNYQEKYCRDTFDIYVEKNKELIYILKNNDNKGWEQNLELECYVNNIPDILNKYLENYLLSNMYPIINTEIKNQYVNYKKNIMCIFEKSF